MAPPGVVAVGGARLCFTHMVMFRHLQECHEPYFEITKKIWILFSPQVSSLFTAFLTQIEMLNYFSKKKEQFTECVLLTVSAR